MNTSPQQRRSALVDGLAVSGFVQIAAGALAGYPYAAASYKPEWVKGLGIQAPGRIRQLHLDLIMMGGLTTATSVALPRLPRAVAVPLAIGTWTNALAFAPLAMRPSLDRSRPFRALVGTSFTVTAVSWVGVAAVALHRWSRRPPHTTER
ncbi:hypothetical protein GCM10009789_38240 [Kribbella sancticallisti]|uniref:Uncharacterized protein n=1 Tax=Kribbella sancticallisti TaxID=460087 RepID=A0ABN2DQ26_9ACTN